MTLTTEFLQRHRACQDQVELFTRLYPQGATVTLPVLIEASRAGLKILWLEQFIPPHLRQQYVKACSPLQRQYVKARARLRQQYDEACAPLWQQYVKACARLWQQYDEACAPHLMAGLQEEAP
jgi:cyclopropane fatty-acyl-phospholipid synthase-like methyltransferase